MFLSVDSQNGVPVYEQIARQIKYRIADAVLAPGDLLPSVRELAKLLAINPNTIARAYRDLSNEGIVDQVPGIGLSVRSGARRECQTQRRRILQERVARVLLEAHQAGLDADAIRNMCETEISRFKPMPHTS